MYKVLYVADDNCCDNQIREVFTQEGVLKAGHAKEAKDLIDEHHASLELVITDLLIPPHAGGKNDIRNGQEVAHYALSKGIKKVICWSSEACQYNTPKGAIGYTRKGEESDVHTLRRIWEGSETVPNKDRGIYTGTYLYGKDIIRTEIHNLRHEILGPLLPLHISLQSYLAGNAAAFNGNEEYMKGLRGLLDEVRKSVEKLAGLEVNGQRLADIDGTENSPKGLIKEIQSFLSNDSSLLVQLCKNLEGCTEVPKINKTKYNSLPEQIDNKLACKLQELVDYVDKQSELK